LLTNVGRLSLSRSGHTLSVVATKAYIFGGTTAAEKLASNDMHAVTLVSAEKPESAYSIVPAVPDIEGGRLPTARTKHAACAFNVCVAVCGGVDESGELIDDGSTIWLFNTAKSTWEFLEAPEAENRPGPRQDAKLFDHQNNLVLYGGVASDGVALKDVWHFSYADRVWTRLPDAPVASHDAAVANGVLHLISTNDSLSSDMHLLKLTPAKDELQEWHAVSFPTNALTPGPRPRNGGGLLPVSTGHGRHYLVYLFGAQQKPGTTGTPVAVTTSEPNEQSQTAAPLYWSDMWTYQLPSALPEVKATTSISDVIKPSKIKDSIRSALGYDSGQHSWAEVEVLPPAELELAEGKVHPGPRGFFGSDMMKDGRSVIIWGGINAKGETEGDGWIIRLE